MNGKLGDTLEAEIYVGGLALSNFALKHGLKLDLVDEKYIPYKPLNISPCPPLRH